MRVHRTRADDSVHVEVVQHKAGQTTDSKQTTDSGQTTDSSVGDKLQGFLSKVTKAVDKGWLALVFVV